MPSIKCQHNYKEKIKESGQLPTKHKHFAVERMPISRRYSGAQREELRTNGVRREVHPYDAYSSMSHDQAQLEWSRITELEGHQVPRFTLQRPLSLVPVLLGYIDPGCSATSPNCGMMDVLFCSAKFA